MFRWARSAKWAQLSVIWSRWARLRGWAVPNKTDQGVHDHLSSNNNYKQIHRICCMLIIRLFFANLKSSGMPIPPLTPGAVTSGIPALFIFSISRWIVRVDTPKIFESSGALINLLFNSSIIIDMILFIFIRRPPNQISLYIIQYLNRYVNTPPSNLSNRSMMWKL